MREQATWTASAYREERPRPASDQQQRTSADIYGYDDRFPARRPTSTRRYTANSAPRTIFRVVKHAEPQRIQRASLYGVPGVTQEPGRARPARTRRVRLHWLASVGIGMLVMLAAWLMLANILNWWQGAQDDWHYGRPRTAQYDVNVGHGGTSHFIAVNLQGHILVTEFQISDPTRSKLYIGPTLFGAGSALAPVTLSFRDVNGDGEPDLLIQVQSNTYVFINDHGSFRLPKQGERLSL